MGEQDETVAGYLFLREGISHLTRTMLPWSQISIYGLSKLIKEAGLGVGVKMTRTDCFTDSAG